MKGKNFSDLNTDTLQQTKANAVCKCDGCKKTKNKKINKLILLWPVVNLF